MLDKRIGNPFISLSISAGYFLLLNSLLVYSMATLLYRNRWLSVSPGIFSFAGYCLLLTLLVISNIIFIRLPLLEIDTYQNYFTGNDWKEHLKENKNFANYEAFLIDLIPLQD